jgi:hypothetical protein
MFVGMTEKKKIQLKCQHCGWIWGYGGKREFFTNCTSCGYHVNIAKNMIPHSGQKIGVHGLSMVSESTPSAPMKEPMIDHE